MVRELSLHNVGPAVDLTLGPLGERLNLIAGDNGLGKSLFLEAIWFATTATWAGEPARPRPDTAAHPPGAYGGDGYLDARIRVALTGDGSGMRHHTYAYRPRAEQWDAGWPSTTHTASGDQSHRLQAKPHAGDGLVVFARVDGGFAVWDEARNTNGWEALPPGRPRSYLFDRDQVWRGTAWCNGLLHDWVLWQGRGDPMFAVLERVLRRLQPSEDEALTPGAPRRLSLDSPSEVPTVRMPYGDEVPVVHLSAGYRRIIALAYVLTWAWHEHVQACRLLAQEPARDLLFLVDEIEAHLHPRWQRTVLRALLAVADELPAARGPRVQLLATTHSPLVLASAEPLFEEERDAVWELDLTDSTVEVRQFPWSRRGDVSRWLTLGRHDPGRARS